MLYLLVVCHVHKGIPGALAQLEDEVEEDADEMEVEDEEEETVTVPDQKDEAMVKMFGV